MFQCYNVDVAYSRVLATAVDLVPTSTSTSSCLGGVRALRFASRAAAAVRFAGARTAARVRDDARRVVPDTAYAVLSIFILVYIPRGSELLNPAVPSTAVPRLKMLG